MSTPITMPQLGETVTEGTVIAWLAQPGDTVTEGQPVVEVSTDKVDSEIPAPATGQLSEIVVPVGETIEVGAVIGHIGSDTPACNTGPARSRRGCACEVIERSPTTATKTGSRWNDEARSSSRPHRTSSTNSTSSNLEGS